MEQRAIERMTLDEEARRQLARPDSLIGDKKAILLLRLWQYPSFERHKVWAVYTQANEKQLLIQRVIWNRHNDLSRLSDPFTGLKKGFHTKPSISSITKNIEPEIFKSYFDEIMTITVPPLTNKDGLGIDGIEFGFEFKTFMASASFSWWCCAPDEWRLLEVWFLKIKNLLNLQFAQLP